MAISRGGTSALVAVGGASSDEDVEVSDTPSLVVGILIEVGGDSDEGLESVMVDIDIDGVDELSPIGVLGTTDGPEVSLVVLEVLGVEFSSVDGG